MTTRSEARPEARRGDRFASDLHEIGGLTPHHLGAGRQSEERLDELGELSELFLRPAQELTIAHRRSGSP